MCRLISPHYHLIPTTLCAGMSSLSLQLYVLQKGFRDMKLTGNPFFSLTKAGNFSDTFFYPNVFRLDKLLELFLLFISGVDNLLG